MVVLLGGGASANSTMIGGSVVVSWQLKLNVLICTQFLKIVRTGIVCNYLVNLDCTVIKMGMNSNNPFIYVGFVLFPC